MKIQRYNEIKSVTNKSGECQFTDKYERMASNLFVSANALNWATVGCGVSKNDSIVFDCSRLLAKLSLVGAVMSNETLC